jgi:restriction endonuclease Mrr
MPEELEKVIVAWLKEHGYSNVESNCGTVWYTGDDGKTYSLSEEECEG